MRKEIKKLTAYACAITLLLSSVVIPNFSTRADEEAGNGEIQSVTTEAETHENGQTSATYAANSSALINSNFVEAGEVGGNQYKITTVDGVVTRLINIQQPGNATEQGIYLVFDDANFGEMTVNGAPLAKYIDGSGLCIYISNFVYMYSDVVIKDSSGKVKTALAVYNAKGIDNKDAALDDGVAEELPILPEGETRAPLALETVTVANRLQQILGNYNYSANPGTDVKVAVDPNNKDHVQLQNLDASGNLTLTKEFSGLQASTRYVVSLDVTLSAANGSYRVASTAVGTVQAHTGTKRISYVTSAYDSTGLGNNNGQINFTIYFSGLGSDVVIDVCNPTVRLATADDMTTAAPTTAAPTTAAPTTVKPTAAETTTAPTTTRPTAIEPTTEPKVDNSGAGEQSTTVAKETIVNKVTAPKRTSVKTASKKKLAKKVKLSIKKIQGANGYRVQFSKTRKFKKVLLTKDVKKAKTSITSKKIKNKKKLYVRVKAYNLDGKKKVLAKRWSKVKRVKIK